MKALHGLVKTGKRITSADISGSVLVDGLKTKFYPHRLDLIQPGKQPNHRLFQTVRSGADGYGTDIRVLDGFGEYSLQIFYRSIGIGVSLKIGNVFMNRAFGRQHLDLLPDLLRNGKGSTGSKITTASCTAENTASFPNLTVTVGTGHAAIQCNLVYLFSEHLPKHIVKGMIRLAVPTGHEPDTWESFPCSCWPSSASVFSFGI